MSGQSLYKPQKLFILVGVALTTGVSFAQADGFLSAYPSILALTDQDLPKLHPAYLGCQRK